MVKEEELELGLSPNIELKKGGLECTIEFEGKGFKFVFEQPVRYVIQLAESTKVEDKYTN
jgi:hypothetical protein